jgi:hypothetical protein
VRTLRFLAIVVGAGLATSAAAQSRQAFDALLTWVPIGGAERNDVAGEGAVTATLVGAQLTIAGTFTGLPARVTGAKLHRGPAKGVRGPAIADLQVTGGVAGTVAGDVHLSTEQIAALEAGQLYIQVHSEKGVLPDHATLFGWLLRAERR